MRCLIRLFLGALLLVGLAVGIGTWWAHRTIRETPFGDYTDGPKTLNVPSGTSAGKIFDQLESTGVITNADLARGYFKLALDSPPLQAGEYVYSEAMTLHDAVDKLVRGDVVTHPITLVEGLTADETAVALADAGFGDLEAFRTEIANTDRIADLDPEASNLEGYLFPDTYRFSGGTSESEIISALVDNFRTQLEAQLGSWLEEQETSSLRDLVTLASIIEKEAKLDDERATISAVYNNRLQRGIALYADPTIIYALKLAGTWDGDIKRKDLSLESPYNTYRVAGLPPTPICSPRIASLVAAAHPADVEYLYFVSRNDGSHVFASSLSEHNRNVYEWQKRYWRERKAAEAAKRSP